MDTTFAYITLKREVEYAFRTVARFDLVCPFCLWDNDIQAVYGLLSHNQDFVTGITCEICKQDFKPAARALIVVSSADAAKDHGADPVEIDRLLLADKVEIDRLLLEKMKERNR